MVNSAFQALVSSESNEWYTPPRFIEAARAVMGRIDIDPASNESAQQWIKAKRFYTKDDNGLDKPWHGRLWLNPPYGQRNIAKGVYGASAWIHKAIDEYRTGNVTEAILLCRGDSDGIHRLEAEFPSCEPCDRIAFISSDDPTKNNPVPGCRFWYLGDDLDAFHLEFCQLGAIRVIHTPSWRLGDAHNC